MKILMFIESLEAGGKERRLVELLKGLEELDDVQCAVVLLSKDIHYREVLDLEIDIHYLTRAYRRDPKIFLTFFQLCKSWKPDIIHTWGAMPSLYAMPTAKLLGSKFINGMVTIAPSGLRSFKYVNLCALLTFPFSDRIVSNSRIALARSGVPERKAVCIHNGFNPERARRLENRDTVRERFGITTEKVVGMVAAFEDRKDYDTYFSAAGRVASAIPDVTFVAVGIGVNYNFYRRKYGPTGHDRILFLGRQDDVESIISIFDVGVLSSYSEGLPNAVLEYMALAKPVVATDVGGTGELVGDGQTGYLVPPESDEQLAHRIRSLLVDAETARCMGKAGRERVLSQFSLDEMTHKYLELYQELLPRQSDTPIPGKTIPSCAFPDESVNVDLKPKRRLSINLKS